MTKRTKACILIGLIFFIGIHTVFWFISSEKKLFSQSIGQLKVSDNFNSAEKVNSFITGGGKFVLCSNLPSPPNFEFLQSPTLILDSETCSKTDTLRILSENSFWQEKQLLQNGDTLITEGGGINVLYTLVNKTDLFSAKTEIGFHLYGTDYYAMCEETKFWILNRWYSIRNESEGIGEINGCPIEPTPTLSNNSSNQ